VSGFRGQMTENREQTPEDRERKTEVRDQNSKIRFRILFSNNEKLNKNQRVRKP
jgi:hypothetical protein